MRRCCVRERRLNASVVVFEHVQSFLVLLFSNYGRVPADGRRWWGWQGKSRWSLERKKI